LLLGWQAVKDGSDALVAAPPSDPLELGAHAWQALHLGPTPRTNAGPASGQAGGAEPLRFGGLLRALTTQVPTTFGPALTDAAAVSSLANSDGAGAGPWAKGVEREAAPPSLGAPSLPLGSIYAALASRGPTVLGVAGVLELLTQAVFVEATAELAGFLMHRLGPVLYRLLGDPMRQLQRVCGACTAALDQLHLHQVGRRHAVHAENTVSPAPSSRQAVECACVLAPALQHHCLACMLFFAMVAALPACRPLDLAIFLMAATCLRCRSQPWPPALGPQGPSGASTSARGATWRRPRGS
jgi:hypothetical protein